MSLSISAAASEGQQSPLPLPALTADAPVASASDGASSSNASIADTVSIGTVLPDRLATYESDGSVKSSKDDTGESITENNAFLAALYAKPAAAAAKPSTTLSI